MALLSIFFITSPVSGCAEKEKSKSLYSLFGVDRIAILFNIYMVIQD
jgi:hypothetical protein